METKKHIVLIQSLGLLTKPNPYLCACYLEPITLQILAASLELKGYETEILAGNVSKEDIHAIIQNFKPFAIGFSVYTYTFNESLFLAREAKQKAKELGYNIFTIFGGYHASALPSEVISNKEVDFVIPGEGDITLSELLETLSQNKNLNQVAGLYFKQNGKIINTKTRPRISNLDNLPWAKRYDKFILSSKNQQLIYPSPSQQISTARIYYARGCPFACEYCSSKNIWGSSVVWRSPKDVVDEIEMLYKKYKTNLISFLDLTFNANRKKVLELCNEFIKRDLPVYWWGLFRGDLLDEEMLKTLAAAKCVKLNIGIESPDDSFAEQIKSGYKTRKKDLIKNLEIANDLGLLLKAFLIIGFESETKEQIKTYSEKLKNFPLDELRITFATPLPASNLWDACLKEGLIPQNPDFSEFTTEHPVIKHPSLSDEEFLELRRELVENFFLSQEYSERIIKKIKNYKHLKSSYLEYFNFIKSNNIFNEKRVIFDKFINDIIRIS